MKVTSKAAPVLTKSSFSRGGEKLLQNTFIMMVMVTVTVTVTVMVMVMVMVKTEDGVSQKSRLRSYYDRRQNIFGHIMTEDKISSVIL